MKNLSEKIAMLLGFLGVIVIIVLICLVIYQQIRHHNAINKIITDITTISEDNNLTGVTVDLSKDSFRYDMAIFCDNFEDLTSTEILNLNNEIRTYCGDPLYSLISGISYYSNGNEYNIVLGEIYKNNEVMYDTDDNFKSSDNSNKTRNLCEVDGCFNEGVKQIVGLNGTYEYYCEKHYNEIMNTVGDMEQNVGNSSASKHTCQAGNCTKEGVYSLTGFSGRPEYYCTEHYNEMMDVLNNMSKDVYGDN